MSYSDAVGKSKVSEAEIREYYGKTLKTTSDLLTNACTCSEAPPEHLRKLIANVDESVSAQYYGCGLVAPELLEGAKVLDLGCGSGRDCYVLAQMVGESGLVVGLDMTQEQLDVALAAEASMAKKFGYKKPNTRFVLGHMENLAELDEMKDLRGTFDVIVSNCVLNLSRHKRQVLSFLLSIFGSLISDFTKFNRCRC